MATKKPIAIRLYRRLFGSSGVAAFGGGACLVLDGNTAVAATADALGAVTETVAANPGGRAALAAAMGRAMAGQRVSVRLSGPELAASLDLLRNAVGRHLPLVIHLVNEALPDQGETLGTGHEALHLAADSGSALFVAANVQEVVDLSLIAHRVAELALVPVVVAMDSDATARSAQDVSLASAELLQQFAGRADDRIDSPTPAQVLLFGEQRRRVPRWHDLDQPQLCGSRQDSDTFALGAMAAGPFFEAHLEALVDEAFTRFGRLSGRPCLRSSGYRMDGASEVLLLQGAAVETARAVADHRGARRGLGLGLGQNRRLGVVNVRCLRPNPAAELVQHLAGRDAVAVLERRGQTLAGDPPLMRELRAAFEQAAENKCYGAGTHPGLPVLEDNQRPRLHSVIYGSGGLPLRATDLLALVDKLRAEAPPSLYLGIEFHNYTPDHPKRQVMLDRLRRAYPQIADLGLRGSEPVELRPDGVLGIAVHRRGTRSDHGPAQVLAGDAGALLQRLLGGRARGGAETATSGPAPDWAMDRLLHSPSDADYPGDLCSLDAALVVGDRGRAAARLGRGLRSGAVLLLTGAYAEVERAAEPAAEVWRQLGADNCKAVRRLGLKLYHLSADEADGGLSPAATGSIDPMSIERANAQRLGALFAALLDTGILDSNRRKVVAAWVDNLDGLEDADVEVLKLAFEYGLDRVAVFDYQDLEDPVAASLRDEVPPAVRHLGGGDETYESLPRFWDQIGVLYAKGEADRLTASPYMAIGMVPPLSATFRDRSPGRALLPVFDADACSGCGNCWSVCPDSAIGAAALTSKALLDAGIGVAKAGALRPLVGKLAGRIAALGRSAAVGGSGAGELIRRAWDELQEKAPLPAERLATVQPDLDAVIAWADGLPLAVTGALFQSGEKLKKDGGEWLSVVINPDACKACGLCISVCPDDAMRAEPQDAERLEQARAMWRTWQGTPDTGSATIERLIETSLEAGLEAGLQTGPDVAGPSSMDPMAAVMLSRYCALAMAGGDAGEPGAGEKIALRMVLAATEYRQQPLMHRFVTELGDARDRMTELLHDTLVESVPTDDLDALAASLRSSDSRQVDLAGLGSGGIETVRLQPLVELARDLGDQHWRLSEGRFGIGRARFSLVVTSGSVADWAAAFPDNPFQAPVVLDMSADPQLAAGLLAGQMEVAMRPFDLLAQAKPIMADPAAVVDPAQKLRWRDLSPEQRALCPPLLLVGNEADLGGKGLAQVLWLLNSGLPIKILVLAELDMGIDTRGVKDGIRGRPLATVNDPRTDLGLMALAQRDAFVAQTSIADGGHVRETVRAALGFAGPALIRFHAPSPRRHGFAADRGIAQARQAVGSRAFPLFRYNPDADGVFGARLDLSGNPDPCSDWRGDDSGAPVTPLTWAASEARFGGHFSPLEADAPAPVEALDWLALDAGARWKKTPMMSFGEGDDARRYRVSTELLERVEHLGDAWRTLQELAGLVTPFTARVEQEAAQRVAAEHRAEVDALRKDYEHRLGEQRDGIQGEIAGRIQERLLVLAGYQ